MSQTRKIVRQINGGYFEDSDGCWYLGPNINTPHFESSSRALRFYRQANLARRYGKTTMSFEGQLRNID